MWSGCPKAGMRLQTEIGEGGSSKRAVGYMSTVGAALTQPELGRMKPKLTNPESPDFSRGECQIVKVLVALTLKVKIRLNDYIQLQTISIPSHPAAGSIAP
ncbi:MAG: hypothetical protein ACTSWV_00520 [Candidatus Asgardarchaeia archaeon]